MYLLLYDLNYRSFTFFAWLSQVIRISYTSIMYIRFLQFRSSLLPESLLLSFPHPTKIFQFGWSRLPCGIHALLACGFAHSDSSGSLLTYSSPKRFAVRRVLLRLLVPRHPLCALFSLTFFLYSNSTFFYLLFKDLFFYFFFWETIKSLKTIYDLNLTTSFWFLFFVYSP